MLQLWDDGSTKGMEMPRIDGQSSCINLDRLFGGVIQAVAISHYSVTTNVIQFAAFNHTAGPREKQRFRPGDVSLGVLPFYHIYAMVVLLHATTFLGVSGSIS